MKIPDWFSPEQLVFLLPLAFPLYLVKLDLAGIPLNLLEILVMLLSVWQIIRWLIGKLSSVKTWKTDLIYFGRQQKYFLLLSGLFLLFSVIAVVIVPKETLLIDGKTLYESRKVALGIFKGWIVSPYLYFLLLWFNTRSKSQLFTSIYAYVFSALPLVIWAVYQYVTGHFITLDGRASGPFVNANYLAMYLAPAVAVLWILIVRGILFGFRVQRFVIGSVLAVLYSVALLMTQSYGAMLAVMAALLLFWIQAYAVHRNFGKSGEVLMLKRIAYFLGVFALITVLSAVLLFAKTDKWKYFTEFQQRSSSSVRLQVYDIAANFISKNPVWGIGFGQFEPKYNLEAPEILGHAPYEWVMLHPHNTFLAVWLNLGIGGLMLFCLLVAHVLVRLFKNNSYDDRFFRLIGVSMLLVILFHGMVDTYLFKNDLAMIFWLVIALAVLPQRKQIIEPAEQNI
jgi:O-antigen ligase